MFVDSVIYDIERSWEHTPYKKTGFKKHVRLLRDAGYIYQDDKNPKRYILRSWPELCGAERGNKINMAMVNISKIDKSTRKLIEFKMRALIMSQKLKQQYYRSIFDLVEQENIINGKLRKKYFKKLLQRVPPDFTKLGLKNLSRLLQLSIAATHRFINKLKDMGFLEIENGVLERTDDRMCSKDWLKVKEEYPKGCFLHKLRVYRQNTNRYLTVSDIHLFLL